MPEFKTTHYENPIIKDLFHLHLFLFSHLAQGQVPSYVPTNGLKAYWGFTGNANDYTANANNGTVIGALLTSDRFGNPNSAYSFNGSSDYISTTYAGIQGKTPGQWPFGQKQPYQVPVCRQCPGEMAYFPLPA